MTFRASAYSSKFLVLLSTMIMSLFSIQSNAAEVHRYKMDVWSDNWFSAYLNGEFLVEDSVSIRTERSFNAETVEFEAGESFLLGFVLKDFIENDTGLEYIGSRRQQMGDGGFIMQVTNLDTNEVVAVSNEGMHCTVIHKAPLNSDCVDESNPVAGQGACQFTKQPEPMDWQSAQFDDSAWSHATEHSKYSVSPKGGYNQIKWNSQAKFIWGEDLEKDNTLLCRLTVGVPSGHVSSHSHSEVHTHTETHSQTGVGTSNKLSSAFRHFTNVKTSEEGNYLSIESNGLPSHNMMTGITNWQQQVPTPQNYKGSNSWKVPLKPELADEPLMTKDHFHRGAIAIAVNGVPIFNAYNNRGEYSADIGELDQWGGHSGRGDDYHYHLAPEHLEAVVGKGNPIAYVLDGFPLYAQTDKELDEYLGRFNEEGTYQYHAVDYPPYLVAGIRGVVAVDSFDNAPEDQIEPQPRSKPVRTGDYRPLKGAEITGFTQLSDSAFSLEYSLKGKTYYVNYSWDEEGNYQFTYVDTDGSEKVETYTLNSQASHKINTNKPTSSIEKREKKGSGRKYCGDGLCDATENSNMCPVDC
ncbi:YHYH protein [Marinomonas sp. C2222]|uniref:YHYH protein n=1 Tax=Marinomonas sargassi TaxID=2984494 RepID=A0ABT2YTM1_9GAMM|nr:YHYH protein [Marinomonas sargassi]MCV2403246.1 YHYH protein [Marinomonas sargassi]